MQDIRALLNPQKLAKRSRVAPLWQEALKAAIPALYSEHPDALVEVLTADVELARRLVQESNAKLRRLPVLADCDAIEILQLPARKIGDKKTPYYSHHYSLRMADVPYQLRAVLKDLFYEAMSPMKPLIPREMLSAPADGGITRTPSPFGVPQKMPDGTVNLRIDLIKKERDQIVCDWASLWLKILEDYGMENDLPDNDEAGSKWDDVSIHDKFSHLQRHTVEYDAYDYWVNENDERMEKEFEEVFCSFFGAKEPWTERMAKSTGGEVWTQRPRMRLIITGSMKSSFPLPRD